MSAPGMAEGRKSRWKRGSRTMAYGFALVVLTLLSVHCKSTTVVPDVCLENQYRCDGTALKRCNGNRTGYDLVRVCPSETSCSETIGTCSDLPRPPNPTLVSVTSLTLPPVVVIGTQATLTGELSRSGPSPTALRLVVSGVNGVAPAPVLLGPTDTRFQIGIDTAAATVQGEVELKLTITNDEVGAFVASSLVRTFLRGRPGTIDTTYGLAGCAVPKALAWSDVFVLSSGEAIIQAYTQSFGNTTWSAEVFSRDGRTTETTFQLPSYGLGPLQATVDRSDRLVSFGGRQGQGTLSRFTKDGKSVPFAESAVPLRGGLTDITANNDGTYLVMGGGVIKFDPSGTKAFDALAPAPTVDVPDPGAPIGMWRLDGGDVLSTSGGGGTLYWARGSSGNFDVPTGTFYFAPEAKRIRSGPGSVPYYLTSRCAVKDIQSPLCLVPNDPSTVLVNIYFSGNGKAALFGRRVVAGSTQGVARIFDENARELLEITLPNDERTFGAGFFGEDHFVLSNLKGVCRYWL